MKKLNLLSILFLGLVILSMVSCENQDQTFPDYDYQTVYFSYQSPVRTIVLGEDNNYDTSLDNEHKCQVYATWGGGYSAKSDVTVNFVVDESLCDNLYFSDGSKVKPMPSSYYTLASNQIVIPEGSISGGVEVQLSDAFFADSLSLETTYVIPLRMVSVQNADSILSGAAKSTVPNPVLTNASDWNVAPKNFVLYAVKYINTWTGYYLRRGKDAVTKDGVASAIARHKQYVEYDDVWKLTALSLNSIKYPMDYQNKLGTDLNMSLTLNFSNDYNFTVGVPYSSFQLNDSVRVYDIAANGTGLFVKDGEKNSWGSKDRDALYMSYSVAYKVEIKYPKLGLAADYQNVTYNTVDTLVARNRGVTSETFTYTKN
jgi:Family of unknown function (DUF5627)/Domain of unknown function (DUF1735)